MKKLLITFMAAGMVGLSACGSGNDYDSHAGDDSITTDSVETRDTIQGRSGEPRDTGISHSRTGIGDTSIKQNQDGPR